MSRRDEHAAFLVEQSSDAAPASVDGLMDHYRRQWMSRGRDLNALYDALTTAIGRSPNGDPVEDLNALAAERDRYRAALVNLMDFGKQIMQSDVESERGIGCCVCEGARVVEGE